MEKELETVSVLITPRGNEGVLGAWLKNERLMTRARRVNWNEPSVNYYAFLEGGHREMALSNGFMALHHVKVYGRSDLLVYAYDQAELSSFLKDVKGSSSGIREDLGLMAVGYVLPELSQEREFSAMLSGYDVRVGRMSKPAGRAFVKTGVFPRRACARLGL